MPDFQTLWWINGLIVFGSLGTLFVVERSFGLPRIWKWSVWCILQGVLSIVAQRVTYRAAMAEGPLATGVCRYRLHRCGHHRNPADVEEQEGEEDTGARVKGAQSVLGRCPGLKFGTNHGRFRQGTVSGTRTSRGPLRSRSSQHSRPEPLATCV